ncbi:MAG: divergent polysaccharide deacetylase family protein [Desulfobacteraceae bacterium]|nr:MAG: divergent polysaccharide deacetylase family protein [Desulfobacteraceae bacterium]
MAKRKKPKKAVQRSKKPGDFKTNISKIFAGFFILLIFVVGAGFFVDYYISKKPAEKKEPVLKQPVFEVYPKEERLSVKTPSKATAQPAGSLPKVAIIIDDMGYDKDMAKNYLDLDAPFTFSLLPFSPFQKSIAAAAYSKGVETMLHLPMEPDEYPDISPGPGALLTSMSPDQLISQLNKDLDDIPFVKGVNNHMGSKMTSIDTQMYQIFSVLKKKGLYFVDSRTSAKTLCKPSARLLKVSFAERDVFLDHVQKPKEIREQINKLVDLARKHGEAVAIMHPYPETYQVVQEMLPYLRKKVNLVPASEIVREIS